MPTGATGCHPSHR